MKGEEEQASARAKLMHQISQEITDQRVLQAMARVPRELFVPPESRHLAYEDIPLPIKEGQTISQPFIVALMTQALQLTGTERVLEVGTGSGYQAAILAELALHVTTVERYPLLADEARQRLEALGNRNIEVMVTGEVLGWPPGAPYDAILVTAAAPRVPQALLDQLAEGGRMVIPVGSRQEQDLMLVTSKGEGISRTSLGACRFVPLVGVEAWPQSGP